MKIKTKLTIGLFSLIILGHSCSNIETTQEEIVKNNVEELLKEKLNDPSSYEFVKIQLIDSVTFNDNIIYRKEFFNKNMEYDFSSLEDQERYKIEIPSMYDEMLVEDLKFKIEKNKNILFKIDSLENLLSERKEEIASYTYMFTFRGNNALGAKVLNEYFIQTDPEPNYNVINITDNKDELFLNPNDFPGYREMIEKTL